MDTSTPANLTARIAALSPEKRALLERKLKQQSTRDSKTDTIPRRATNDAPPLSFAQQRLWFLDQLEPDRATYNIPFAVRLQGPLDVNAFRHAVNALVERHEVLRTTFTNRDGNPIQTVSQQLTLPFPILDLQSWSESEREAEALRLAEQEVRLPFDLAHGPLLRTLLVQIGNEDYLLVITMHHIISDGWSMSVFTRELGCFYDALSNGRAPTLPSLPIQYADFAVWQRQQLQGEGLTQEVTYWKQQLSEAPSPGTAHRLSSTSPAILPRGSACLHGAAHSHSSTQACQPAGRGNAVHDVVGSLSDPDRTLLWPRRCGCRVSGCQSATNRN